LVAAFLDVKKAFDLINHQHLLNIMEELKIPRAFQWTVHRFLSRFSLKILGKVTPVQRGTMQGSPLSPLLCIVFLWDLINWLNGKKGTAFSGMVMPWKAVSAAAAVIKVLLFADDTTLLAETVEDLQAGLDLLTEWANYRRILFNIDKSAIMVVARLPAHQPRDHAFYLQGRKLLRVSEFRYLGHTIHEAPIPTIKHPKPRYSLKAVLDIKALQSKLLSLKLLFGQRSAAIMPQVIRQVVIQQVFAKALYPTALLDVDYQTIDSEIYYALSYLFGMPFASSATYLQKELRIWPSILYAHRRALRLAWKLGNTYWTASIFRQWQSQTKASPLFASWVPGGVLRRVTKILSRYHLAWDDILRTKTWPEWCQLVSKALSQAVTDQCNKAAERRHFSPLGGSLVAFDSPMPRYLRKGGILAIAAIRFRSPILRSDPNNCTLNHLIPCRYCGKPGECGRHLIECHAVPPPLLSRKEAILSRIAMEVNLTYNPTRRRQQHLMELMFNLQWQGQSEELLEITLIFMRDVLSSHADYTPPHEPTYLRSVPVAHPRPKYLSYFRN